MSCLLVCRNLIGDHRKKKRLHGPRCASAKELLQVLAEVALEKFPTLSDQKAVSKPPPTLLNSRPVCNHIPAQPCSAKKSRAHIFPKFVMYNNVIVAPLLPKIADCAQQDRVLDLTRLFPSLAVGKGSGPRDYCKPKACKTRNKQRK